MPEAIQICFLFTAIVGRGIPGHAGGFASQNRIAIGNQFISLREIRTIQEAGPYECE